MYVYDMSIYIHISMCVRSFVHSIVATTWMANREDENQQLLLKLRLLEAKLKNPNKLNKAIISEGQQNFSASGAASSFDDSSDVSPLPQQGGTVGAHTSAASASCRSRKGHKAAKAGAVQYGVGGDDADGEGESDAEFSRCSKVRPPLPLPCVPHPHAQYICTCSGTPEGCYGCGAWRGCRWCWQAWA